MTQNPKKVLILFAGAASEAMDLHDRKGNKVETTSVELNPAIQKILYAHDDIQLEKFLKNEPASYVVSDNRLFLENNKDIFDTVIFSWSGATVANYSGAILHTTQFSFTVESMRKTISHLAKNGIIIFCGANKINLLYILKQIMSERGLPADSLAQRIVILSNRQDNYWNSGWDPFIMIYKDGLFSQEDVNSLKQTDLKGVETQLPFEIILSPYETKYEGMKVFKEIIDSKDLSVTTKHLQAAHSITPLLASDDHPYIHQIKSTWEILNPFSLFTLSGNFPTTIDYGAVLFSLLLGAAAWWLFTKSRNLGLFRTPGFLNFLSWAPFSTAMNGFLMYKAILYFGQPTYAFIVVHLSLQAGTLLSSLRPVKAMLDPVRRKKYFMSCILFFIFLVFSFKTDFLPATLFTLQTSATMALFVLAGCLWSYLISGFYLTQFFGQNSSDSEPIRREKLLLTWLFETFLSGFSLFIFIKVTEGAGLTAASGTLLIMGGALIMLASYTGRQGTEKN